VKNLQSVIIITGHYGVGKTTVATKLALALSAQGNGKEVGLCPTTRSELSRQAKESGVKVAIADLDIVNPYFCAVEHEELFAKHGITLCASPLKRSGTSMDVPSLNLNIEGVLASHDYLIIDAGGDAEGAKVLGRYREALERLQGSRALPDDAQRAVAKRRSREVGGYDMICVVNAYRHQTQQPEQAVRILREIEAVSKLKATAIYNNSHLCNETTADIITASVPFAQKVAELVDLPLWQGSRALPDDAQ